MENTCIHTFKPVNVYMDISLVSINDFDEVAGTIKIVAILNISWNDESLVWDTSVYGNTTSLTFTQGKIWLPQMFLLNPAESNEPISNKHFKVTVTHTGDVQWNSGGMLKAICTPDVSKFPFDQHTCTLEMSAWGFLTKQVTLTIPSPTVNLKLYNVNNEWDVIDSNTTLWSDTFDIAKYSITIKRRYLNFLVTVVIPIIMLALVNPFVFILPFNSGERTSYSITVLLAFTVNMTVVSDRMPSSSHPMSHLSYYILSMISVSAVIVIVNIFQTRTYSKGDRNQPIPRYICKSVDFLQQICRRNRIGIKTKRVLTQSSRNDQTVTNEAIEKTLHLENSESPDTTDEPLSESVGSKAGEHRIANDGVHEPTWDAVAKMFDRQGFRKQF
ncbi:acetylcholine receptor subunit beta-type unc-29-like [Ylistrum balloti]|uniref:acetylcholine receptor subunit beta-type unc-29-like n=1 Tax=Ylistrum balloti TaxID=509963 RepID=UPI002905EE05|nr:acetylcholine receptor subunit beta-type unc-29-like [Ylistrum balloti]